MLAQKEIVGIILTGGISSRLGQDKCTLRLPFSEGEQSLLEHTISLLKRVLTKVYLIGRTLEEFPNIPSLSDDIPNKGPLGGIATALLHLQCPCLVLPVDLPFMQTSVLEQLISSRQQGLNDYGSIPPTTKHLTCFMHMPTRRIEPLVAIYEPCCSSNLIVAQSNEKLRLNTAISKENRQTITYSTKDALPFFSLNYPADLQIALRLLSTK